MNVGIGLGVGVVGVGATVGVAVGKRVGVAIGVGGGIGVNVGVGVDEVQATNAGTTAIANKANKVLRCSTTIAKTLPCMAKAIMTLSLVGKCKINVVGLGRRGWTSGSCYTCQKSSILPVWGALGVVARATDLCIIS